MMTSLLNNYCAMLAFLAFAFNVQFIELSIVGVVILKSKLPFLDFKSVLFAVLIKDVNTITMTSLFMKFYRIRVFIKI